MSSRVPDFAEFCSSPEFLAEPISPAWIVFYAAMEGLPLTPEQAELYRTCTGRSEYAPRTYTECSGIIGRRGEKTTTAIKYLLWKILFADWQHQGSWLGKRRRKHVPIIAQDVRVAHDILSTAKSLVTHSPIVSQEVADVLAHEIKFKNRISMVALPASKASTRGLTIPACLLDELNFVTIDGADDTELVRQVRPGMIQFGDSRRLLKLSTPWRSSGLMYEEYMHRYELQNLLCWQASIATMTPRIDSAELERERLTDETYFNREYLALFTSDLDSLIPERDIRAAICTWSELSPAPERYYIACIDASGLSGGDRFTFSIAHGEDDSVQVVDLLRGWRREPVPEVLDEISSLCRNYRVTQIIGDQYSHSFVAELLRQRDIVLNQFSFTARSKPEIYFDLKAILASAKLRLPNHPECIRELRALESIRTSGGGYKIGGAHGTHDDYATVLALTAHRLKQCRPREPILTWVDFNERPADDSAHRSEEDLRSLSREEHFFKHGPSFR